MIIRETTPGGKMSKPRFNGEMKVTHSATLTGGEWDDKIKNYVGGGKPKSLDFTFYDAERGKDVRLTLSPSEVSEMMAYLRRLEVNYAERQARENRTRG